MIFVRSQVRSVRLDLPAVTGLVRRILSGLRESSADVSLTFVGDRRMHRLNKQFRRRDRTTDVLAFAARDAHIPAAAAGKGESLGDVVISVSMAARQARRGSRSLEEEIAALLVHGVLHLCGYDHERSRSEATRMQRRERSLFKQLRPIPRFAVGARTR